MATRSDAAAATITVRRVVAAPVEEIFEYLTQPELMAQWMSPYPGEVQCEARSNFRVGGSFSLSMRSGEKACEITGEYVKVEPPHRLVFTWSGPPTNNASTLVSVELRPLAGKTEFTLVHEKLPTPEVREGHVGGWNTMFDHLASRFGPG